MTVTARLRLDASAFELGRALDIPAATTVELDRVVPLGERAVPSFRAHDRPCDALASRLASDPAVEAVRPFGPESDSARYALEWTGGPGTVLGAVREGGGQLCSATGTADRWELELRFPDHRALSTFRKRCAGAGVAFDVLRVSGATEPEAGPWYGLTRPQREALVTAVDRGYYDIPRRTSTQELADHLGISDQATTERLRRGIAELVGNTLVGSEARARVEQPIQG